MRKLLFSFSVLIGLLAYAQPYELPLYFEDAQGRKDTVMIGVEIPNSTNTLDPSFGEINLIGEPWDSLEARVIRSTSDDTFFYNFFNEVDSVNHELKVDYRYMASSYHTWFFEIKFEAYDYPILIKSEINHDAFYFALDQGSYFMLDSSNSVEAQNYPNVKVFHEVEDTVYLVTDTNYNKLLVKFEHLIGVNESQKQFSLEIYPNPSNGLININSNKIIHYIEFSTLDGRTCKREVVNDLTYTTCPSLDSGVYLVNVLYEDGIFETKRLVIE